MSLALEQPVSDRPKKGALSLQGMTLTLKAITSLNKEARLLNSIFPKR